MKCFFLVALICLGSEVVGQSFCTISKENLYEIVSRETDSLYVINFWATWCAPCVAELPFLIEFANQTPRVALYFISLDFLSDTARLKKLIAHQKIKYPVYLLTETDANVWIDKIETQWSGAIPATLFYSRQNKYFHEGNFANLDDIRNVVQKHLDK